MTAIAGACDLLYKAGAISTVEGAGDCFFRISTRYFKVIIAGSKGATALLASILLTELHIFI
ncbi:MAG: hypothetical protein J0I84_18260 [Terrimonas sp.]|nr:hypothetical protein [Terrimonas sp.]OJY86258.1 MAG: hypothetical protein BGP13_05680 [Sphingobacteriales bacterium 40-81]